MDVGPNSFTILLQSSVGTLEAHSEVGVYLASFRVPNYKRSATRAASKRNAGL